MNYYNYYYLKIIPLKNTVNKSKITVVDTPYTNKFNFFLIEYKIRQSFFLNKNKKLTLIVACGGIFGLNLL